MLGFRCSFLSFRCCAIYISITAWNCDFPRFLPDFEPFVLVSPDFWICGLYISIGGDSDTIGCIAGSIAEPLFGVPLDIYRKAKTYLTPELIKILDKFEGKFGSMVPA